MKPDNGAHPDRTDVKMKRIIEMRRRGAFSPPFLFSTPMRGLALISVLAVLALLVMSGIAHSSNVTKVVCVCHCKCEVNVKPILQRLDKIVKLLEEENRLLMNISKKLDRTNTLIVKSVKSIASTAGTVSTFINILNTSITGNATNVTFLPVPTGTGVCPDIIQQIFVGVPELRCFAPSSWLGPRGAVTLVNASVIAFLAAVSLWSIVGEITSGRDPAEAFRRSGGLLIKCCVAGILLVLLPSIISVWNQLVFTVTNWNVFYAGFVAWGIMTVLTVLPLLVPLAGIIIPAVSKIPGSILQLHIITTGFVALMLYLKLLIALIMQICLPIGIALQEVRIRALRSLGIAIEGTFWGLLVGTLLGAVVTQLIGGMYVHAGEVAAWGVKTLLHAAAAAASLAAEYVKCNIFGWLFHCHVNYSALAQKIALDAIQGLNALLIQAPTLLILAALGSITPLVTVAVVMWKKFTPLNFLDLVIAAEAGIRFTAAEYYSRKREIVQQVQQRLERKRLEEAPEK